MRNYYCYKTIRCNGRVGDIYTCNGKFVIRISKFNHSAYLDSDLEMPEIELSRTTKDIESYVVDLMNNIGE